MTLRRLPTLSRLRFPSISFRNNELEKLRTIEGRVPDPKPEVRELIDVNDLVPRVSDVQLRNSLGLPEDFDTAELRSDPPSVYADLNTGARMDSLRNEVTSGAVVPENDERSNALLGALDFLRQKTPLGIVFKGLELYDEYIGQPFTALTVDLVQKLMPGEQEIEALTKKFQDQGMGFVEARVTAFEASDLPGAVKFGLRFMLDPLVVAGAVKIGLGALRGGEAALAATVAKATKDIPKVTTTRKRTIDELLEAGEFKTPLAPFEQKAGIVRPRTSEELGERLKEVDADSKLLRRVEGKTFKVAEDLDDFSGPETEFLENLLGDVDFSFANIRIAVRKELDLNETRRTLMRSRIDEKILLESEAKAAAIERGIERIGLEEIITKGTGIVGGSAGQKVFQLPATAEVLAQVQPHKLAPTTGPLSWFTRAIDPSALAPKGSPDHLLVGWHRMQVMGQGFSELTMSHVKAQRVALKSFGMKDGRIGALAGKPAWGDVFQNPTAFKLTEQQASYIDEYHKISDEVLGMFKREGIDVKEIDFLDGAMHYVARKVDVGTGQRVWKLEPVSSFGNKAFFEKSRLFETMEEGMKQGLRYLDPEETLQAYLRSAYRRISDKRLNDALLPFTRSIKRGAVQVSEARLQNVPAFSTRVFTGPNAKTTAAKVENALRETGSAIWSVPADASNMLRTMRATTDMATPFIQGLPLLFRSPGAWAKTVGLSWQGLLDKGVRSRYIRNNADEIANMIEHGGLLGSSEFMEGLAAGGWLARVPGAKAALGPFQSSFETFIDVSRIELWKGLRATAAREGQLDDLAVFVNKMSGSISTQAMGVPLSQRQMEASLMFFAPRYTRAIAGLFLDMTRGGLRGNEARRALGSMFAGMTGLHYAVNTALGQDVNLDPRMGNFLKTRIGDQWVGFGAKPRSLVRMMADVVEAAQKNPEGFLGWNIFDAETTRDNPFITWMRSSGAPAPGSILTMISGEDAIGRKIPLDDPIDWVKFIGTQTAPFAFSAAIEDGQISFIGTGAELAGAITTPIAASQERGRLRDKYADEQFGKQWDDLALDERVDVEAAHEDLQEISEEAREEQRQWGRNQDRVNALDAIEEAKKRQIEGLALGAQAFDAGIFGQRKGKEFRDAVHDAGRRYAGSLDTIKTDLFPDVFADFQEFKDGLDRNPVDVAYDEYIAQVFSSDDVLDEFGRFDFNASELVKQELRGKWGDEIIDRVEAERARRKRAPAAGELHPRVLEYYDALDLLQPFWNVYKQRLSGEDLQIYELFLKSSPANQQEVLRTNFRIRQIRARVQDAEERFRRDNAEVDWALVMFFDRVPVHPDNRRKLS